MNNEDLDFFDNTSESSEHANIPRVSIFNEAPELFNCTKINLTHSIKLPKNNFCFEEKKLNLTNIIDNKKHAINNSKNNQKIKIIDLDNKVQNDTNNNLLRKKTCKFEKIIIEKENRRSLLLKEQKKAINKSIDFSINKNKDKIKLPKKKSANKTQNHTKLKSQNIEKKITILKKNNNDKKYYLLNKKNIQKTEHKKYFRQFTGNITKENFINKTKSEFKSKFNLTNTANIKSNILIDGKIKKFNHSSKLLSSFKYDLNKQKTKTKSNKIILKNCKKQKKEIQQVNTRLSLPPNKEKIIKNKKDKISVSIDLNKTNKITSRIINTEKEKEIEKNNTSIEKRIKTVSSSNDIFSPNNNIKNMVKSHYFLSKAGTDEYGHLKINQDSYLILQGINGLKNFNIFGVFDGHGPEGHLVSQFVARYFQIEFKRNKFLENIKDEDKIYEKMSSNHFRFIKELFKTADDILRDQEIESRNSGTTCVIVIHIGSHIICANAGDSRAILVYDKNKNSNYKVFPLSIDSKPELKEEKERINKMGGAVHKIKNKYGNEIGPYRVWAKGKDFPGLAMSRSIGDFNGKNVGIIPIPQIIENNFENNICYIVICSDGVWEFLDNEDVMKIGNKYYKENNQRGFCSEIIDVATKCWRKEDVVTDDITIITVFF